jgi:DNA repair protein RadA/Sms
MGGGIVSGSVSLIGGEPGVGKSTLILQIASLISHQLPTLYVSGEEAIDQIALRARRLGFQDTPQLQAVAATNVNDILSLVSKPHSPQLLIIDSVQTMFVNGIESAPGTVSQVRAVAQILISFAKKSGCALIMIGHMTKDGSLAGPRVLEHMVDTVLYIEGEKGHHFRILRSSKNRFGATDEIGVFDMTEKGLQQVPNPSELFLSARQKNVPGTAVFAGMEGSRPVLVEIQALVAPSPFSAPRRAVVGWDSNRLAMILAILETRAGYLLSSSDVYLNVVGGLRISETAADLAACSALVSALIGKPLPDNTIIFGETGLTGEVRTVSHTDTRLREASKLGFSNALIPKQKKSSHINISTTFAQNINTLQELFS